MDSIEMPENESLEEFELRVRSELFDELKEHLDFLTSTYNLRNSFQKLFEDQYIKYLPNTLIAHDRIITRIAEFLRTIEILCYTGYPYQAGALSASVYELYHTLLYIGDDSKKASKYLNSDDINESIRNLFVNWQKLTKENFEKFNPNNDPEYEYQIYRQLCAFKHNSPKLQKHVILKDEQSIISPIGPYNDEMSINHSWFAMEHSGRMMLGSIGCSLKLHFKFGDPFWGNMTQLFSICDKKYNSIKKKGHNRYGNIPNPFLRT